MNVTVHVAETPDGRDLSYIVVEGEPHVEVARPSTKLEGLHLDRAWNAGALICVGDGRRAFGFVRISWLAEIVGPDNRARLIELRRRLLAVSEAVERSPDGDVTVHFAQDHRA